jgi:hypothetical protein
MVLPSGAIVDDSKSDFLKGVIPPPDSTPLDAATRDWLVSIYRALPDHFHTIEQVPQQEN